MKIKKISKPAVSAAAEPAAATGGATIADRFKLDAPVAAKPTKTVGKTSATIALIAGLLALGVSGVLAYTLYAHWQFLMPC